jgi:FtsH-binding integral membrane protein
MYLMSTGGQNGFDKTRFGLLLGFGFLKGLSLGGLIEHALYMDAGLVVTALLATTVVFGCFSACAMFAKRRSWLYIGGMLGSVMFYMAIASIANIFLGWHIINEVQIYLGLFVFSGYVVFDTQVIIEKASQGQRDVIAHALELFIDFAAIFVRILIILMRNRESEDRRKRNRN